MKIKLLAIALTTLALTACGNDKPADTTKKSDVAPSADSIIIATESSFKPFSYLDTSGNVVGFEIDLAHALCEQMQVTCKIESQDWDSLIPSLQANKSDAIMAGMSVTPERSQVIDFSEPYFENTIILVGKKGDTTTINDVDGKTVGAQQATVSVEYLQKNHPKATVKTYDKQDNVYLDLTAGRIDYMLSDSIPAMDWLKSEQGSDYEIKGAPIDINDKIAIGVRQGDELKGKFNTALAELKANGKLDEIKNKYFGMDTPNHPKPTTDTATTDTKADTSTDTATDTATDTDEKPKAAAQ